MGAREEKATLALLEALGSSLDIQIVLDRAYPLLLQLVLADHAALGVSRSGRPEDFEWRAALPPAFFAGYAEMAPHDFVRAAVARQPNLVLRDQEMVARSELEANMMYHRARELGSPLEQVMAVMLPVDEGQSGLSLYRERRRPFSERERATLQGVTVAIANAVRNCRRFGAAAGWKSALTALLEDRSASVVLLAPPAIEVARTERAAAIIERWFNPHERRPGSLPSELLDLVRRASPAPLAWTKHGSDAILRVSLLELPAGEAGAARWMLVFEERPQAVSLPAEWRALLTPRQQQMSEAVLRGWDNRLIASELGCAEGTVKRHLQSVYDKLGVPSRAALLARAELERRGF